MTAWHCVRCEHRWTAVAVPERCPACRVIAFDVPRGTRRLYPAEDTRPYGPRSRGKT